MGLKEIINKALKDLNKIPYHIQKWESLKEELKNRGAEKYGKKAKKVEVEEAEKVLAVLEKLSERFNYKNIKENLQKFGESKKERSDFERILKLCRLEGNVLGMLDALADTGYFIGYGSEKSLNIIEYDLEVFEELIKDDLFIKYKSIFEALKTNLGYENGGSLIFDFYSNQMDKIIKLARVKGDVNGAICLLANEGYQINKAGITDTDVGCIEKIAKSLQEEKSSIETVSLFLYKEGNPDIFKNYFSSLSDEGQKTVLNKILELDYENKEIIDWLNEKNYEILQKAGFS